MWTTIIEALGVLLLAGFAFALWPPAALAVIGTACLLASWRIETAKAVTAKRKAGIR